METILVIIVSICSALVGWGVVALIANRNKEEEYETVSCDTCKCLLYKSGAQKIEDGFLVFYYCLAHKKPYSRVEIVHNQSYRGFDFTKKYYTELEVNEKGEPIISKKK